LIASSFKLELSRFLLLPFSAIILENDILFVLSRVKSIVLAHGFAIWLWAFVFARVPLVVIQEYFGLASRPFMLINIISLGIFFLAAFDRGLKPLLIFKYRPFLIVLSSFLIFWLFYFFRLGFDSFIQPLIFIETPFSLSKAFVVSTLVPVLCLPWIFNIRSCVDSLVICSALGNISIFAGIIAFLNKELAASQIRSDLRFSFDDLNPIPAGHSSASLVIFGLILLIFANKKMSSFGANFLFLNSGISVFLGLWGMRLSQTKSAYLALVPVIIFCFYLMLKQTRYRWLLTVLVPLLLVWAFPGKRVFTSALNFQDGSVGERLEMFAATWEWIYAHPYLGVGFNLQPILNSLPISPGTFWYPHNLFLDVLGIGGLLMLAPLLVFIFSIVRLIYLELSFVRARDPLFLAFVFLWIQSVLLSCFSGHMTHLPGFWVGGLMVVFASIRESNLTSGQAA